MMESPPPARIPAVVLLSGGLDSAICVADAIDNGFAVHALSIDYGQRHHWELEAARSISQAGGATSHKVISINLNLIGGSALTDDISVPKDRVPSKVGGTDASNDEDIPVTYVPARNLIFLSIATAYAESLSARDIFIGVNAIDYSGYPDCRPAFIESFQETVNLGTKAGVEGHPMRIHTPLLHMSKAMIVQRGIELGVDLGLTLSCYDPVVTDDTRRPCGHCDACLLRQEGFRQAGVADPALT